MIKVIATFLMFYTPFGFSPVVALSHGAAQAKESKVPTVSLCDLVQHSQLYDKKIVRLEAIYAVNFEWVLLYDTTCRGANVYLYPIVAGNNDAASKSMENTILKNLRLGRDSGDRVGLVMKGQIVAPKKHEPGREAGNDWPEFKIMEIEKVVEITKNVPGPKGW